MKYDKYNFIKYKNLKKLNAKFVEINKINLNR